jgi:hypothetical protein
VDDGLAVELVGGAGADGQHASDRQLAGRSERGRESLRPQLAEGLEGLQLTAGPPVELAEGAVERGLADDRDREDVGLDLPWLVGDDAQLLGSGTPAGARLQVGAAEGIVGAV